MTDIPKKSYPLTIWSGLFEEKHRLVIGNAIWLFCILIDKTTFEEDGEGYVLGGKPCTYADFKDRIGVGDRQYKRHLDILRNGNYIHTRRTPHGLIIVIHKSKKWNARSRHHRTKMSPRSDINVPTDVSEMSHVYIDNKEDIKGTEEQILFVWNRVRGIFNLPNRALVGYAIDIADTIDRLGYDETNEVLDIFVKTTEDHPPHGKIKDITVLFHWKKIDAYLSELPKPREKYYFTCLKCGLSRQILRREISSVELYLDDTKSFCCGQKKIDVTGIVVGAYASGMVRTQIRVVIGNHVKQVNAALSESGETL